MTKFETKNEKNEREFRSSNNEPIKCEECHGTTFEEVDNYYDERGKVEYTLICSECGLVAGIWSYGKWLY